MGLAALNSGIVTNLPHRIGSNIWKTYFFLGDKIKYLGKTFFFKIGFNLTKYLENILSLKQGKK